MSDNGDNFLLGEIKATVTGTAEDVRALRLEVGDVARRVTAVEQDQAALRAERAPMVEGYNKFFHRVNNHLQADIAWKAAHDSAEKTTRRHFYVMSVVVGLVASIATILARVLLHV